MVCLSVGLSVTIVSPAKTAEPMEVLGLLTLVVRLRNHVVDGVQIPVRIGNFEWERRRPIAVNCAKTAEPIEMPFGMLNGVGWHRRRAQVISKKTSGQSNLT